MRIAFRLEVASLSRRGFFRGMSGHDNFVRWSRVEVDLGMAEFGALANGFTTIETSRVAQRLKIITNNNGTRQERQR